MIGRGRGGEKGCKKGRVTIDLLVNPNYYNSYKRKLRPSKGELKSMGTAMEREGSLSNLHHSHYTRA